MSDEPMTQREREMLHAIIADCNALIDPEEHAGLNARINAVLMPCDAAGTCVVALPAVQVSATKGDELRAALLLLRVDGDDPYCWCGFNVGMGPHDERCLAAKAAIGSSGYTVTAVQVSGEGERPGELERER